MKKAKKQNAKLIISFFIAFEISTFLGCGGSVNERDAEEIDAQDGNFEENDLEVNPDIIEISNDENPFPDINTDEFDFTDSLPDDFITGDDTEEEEVWIDNDLDGHPIWEDCDDNDPEVIPGTIRSCTSACDYGTQTCISGSWTPCTASNDCTCSTPGETQIIDCGKCGQASRTCTSSHTWTTPTNCYGERECFAGEVDEGKCGFCGLQTRLCNSSCEWLDWSECAHPGECNPGDEYYDYLGCELGFIKRYYCDSATCQWIPDPECTNNCPGSPRTGDYKDEICIPGGPFIMGCPDSRTFCSSEERPSHIVYLTPYYIDKYEVTNARYRECVEAGVCSDPASLSTYFRSGTENWAVNYVSWRQAKTFCQWDGGRDLPTEAQWEKSAKGPYPLDPQYPWGDTPPSGCDEYPSIECSGPTYPTSVEDYPIDESYYGVIHLLDNAKEYVNDYYSATYYSISPELDPPGPATGYSKVIRGYPKDGTSSMERVTRRALVRDENDSFDSDGFRCARPAIQNH